MSFRTTLIVAAILIALGLWAYFGEYKGSEKKEKQEQAKKTLFQIKKEDISEIRIDGLEQPVDLVPSTKDSWKMVSPIAGKADDATVDRIIGDFGDFKYRDIISEK